MGTNTSRPNDVDAALDAIRRIVHALRASSRWAERHVGLSGAQLFVLQKLKEQPMMSVNELASRTHTHQSSVSTVVSRLVDRGLVRRMRSPLDGRRVELTLAGSATRLAGRAPDLAQDRLIRALRQLSSARRRELAETLGTLAHAVHDDGRPAQMFFEERTGRSTRKRSASPRG